MPIDHSDPLRRQQVGGHPSIATSGQYDFEVIREMVEAACSFALGNMAAASSEHKRLVLEGWGGDWRIER
jgi:hypothetical protein